MDDYRQQREQDKFKETVSGATSIKMTPEVDARYIIFDADDSQPDYIGLNESASALTSDGTWTVLKFTYSGSNITEIKKAYGVWDDRATLF